MTKLILGLSSTGQPVRWMDTQTAIRLLYLDLVAWSLGDLTDHFGGINRISGNRSCMSVPSIMAIKGIHTKTRRIVSLSNRALFGRDQHTCAYCGNEFQPSKLTRDHIIPVSRGGKNSWTNVTAACKKCNNRKDNKTPEEAGMSLIWLPYTPCVNEAMILANRNILFDQAEFLVRTLPAHSRVLNLLDTFN